MFFQKITQVFKKRAGIKIGSAFLSDNSRKMHTHIVGATGSGKTVCIEHLLFSDLKRGYGAIIVDPKGEREFFDRIKAYCREIGREDDLHLISATNFHESVVWNPCGLGNVSELQTKFFNSAIYSEPHYAKACEAALLNAFNTLTQNFPHGFGIRELVDELKVLSTKTKEKNIEGLFYDLFNLCEGEWGSVLGTKDSAQKEISILDVIQKGKILFLDLPTEGKLVQSARIGRLLTQEIILISGLRKRFPELKSVNPYSVFIDEFDAFGTESFISFLNKGRSSGFLITIAHQTLSDLKKISPTFEGQVIGNTDVRFVFRQNDPKDCETWAKIFGTKKVIKQTYQSASGMNTGAASNRESLEFKIHPDLIKDQLTGRCVFHIKSERKLKKLKIPRPLALDLGSLEKPNPQSVEARALKSKSVQKMEIEELTYPQAKVKVENSESSYSFLNPVKTIAMVLLLSGSVFSGCAFQKSDNANQGIPTSQSGGEAPKPSVLQVEAFYGNDLSESRSLEKKKEYYTTLVPLVIPYPVPEKILFKITSPAIEGIDYRVSGVLNVNGFSPLLKTELVSKETIDHQIRWEIEVSKLGDAFPFTEGMAFLLHFHLYTKKESIDVEFAARTAPKPPQIEEIVLNAFSNGYFVGPREQVNLIKKYEIKNTSDFSIQTELPYQVRGNVFRKVTHSTPLQNHCRTDFDTKTFKSLTHGKFLMVPESVVAGEFKTLSLHLEEPVFSVVLKPGESRRIYLVLLNDFQLTSLFKEDACKKKPQTFVTGCRQADCEEWKTETKCRYSWKGDREICESKQVCVHYRDEPNSFADLFEHYDLLASGYEILNPINFTKIFYQEIPKEVTPVGTFFTRVAQLEALFGEFNNELPLDLIPEECGMY